MTGAKVNGRIVTIDHTLKSGDVVDIITSASSTGPKRDWMQIVKTSSARTKMKQWFKKERRAENIAEGKNEILSEMRKFPGSFNEEQFLSITNTVANRIIEINGKKTYDRQVTYDEYVDEKHT